MQLTSNSHPAVEAPGIADARHPLLGMGPTIAVYVWQYPMRLFHWGMVISIVVLSFTGYYIHSPFIIGQVKYPFLMGWFRFVHEVFGMVLIALFLLRLYMFFMGNRWSNWRQYVPIRKQQFQEMLQVMKFYAFLRPTPVSKVGHNPMAAFSYLVLYGLIALEIATGLVMFNWLRHSPLLGPLVNWIPRVVSFPNLRLIHFFLLFVFLAFGIFHVHLAMLISRCEKRGLIDSIFTGYKLIPAEEMDEEEKQAVAEQA